MKSCHRLEISKGKTLRRQQVLANVAKTTSPEQQSQGPKLHFEQLNMFHSNRNSKILLLGRETDNVKILSQLSCHRPALLFLGRSKPRSSCLPGRIMLIGEPECALSLSTYATSCFLSRVSRSFVTTYSVSSTSP